MNRAGGRAANAQRGGGYSAAQSQALDELLVSGRPRCLQVIEQFAALIDELHQSATRGVVALVGAEVRTKPIDALRKQRDLDFGRARILGIAAVLGNHTALVFCGQGHGRWKPLCWTSNGSF